MVFIFSTFSDPFRRRGSADLYIYTPQPIVFETSLYITSRVVYHYCVYVMTCGRRGLELGRSQRHVDGL